MMMGMVTLGTATPPSTDLTWNTTSPPSGVTFSAADTTFSSSQGFNQMCIANVPSLSGKQCWSISYTGTLNDIAVGVATAAFNPNTAPGDETISNGFHTGGGSAGVVFNNGSGLNTAWVGVAHTDGLIVGWDTATNTIEIFKNGTSIGTQVCPALGAAAFPAAGTYNNQAVTIFRTTSPPAGYTAI